MVPTKEKIKTDILELCSESEYGSWEFWSNAESKSEEEANLIVKAIVELVNDKLIIPTNGKHVEDQTYKEVSLDVDRLTNEVTLSIPYTVDPNTFYWFYATDEGKKQDLNNRV
jgi:hypothetical protein